MSVMHHRIVDGDVAARLRSRTSSRGAILAEDIERQRARARVDEGDRLVDVAIGQDRQERAEDFLLHDAHLGGRAQHERGSELPWIGGIRRADLQDLRAFRVRVVDSPSRRAR